MFLQVYSERDYHHRVLLEKKKKLLVFCGKLFIVLIKTLLSGD